MNKEKYLEKLAEFKGHLPKVKFGEKPTDKQKEMTKKVNEALVKLKNYYINKNKPCDVGDVVTIVMHSGRKVSNVTVLELGFYHDQSIGVTYYKEGSKSKTITDPVQSLVVVSKCNS